MASRDGTVSELRIVLLGGNSSEISRVGNFILGREAFDTEPPPLSVQQHSERARGKVEGRYVTLIHATPVFDPNLSLDQVSARFRECLYLSAPGPHVFLVVLQSGTLRQEDQERMGSMVHGPWLMKYTILLSPEEGVRPHAAAEAQRESSQPFHLVLRKSEEGNKVQVLRLLEKIDEVVRRNGGGHLIYHTTEQCQPEENISRKESRIFKRRSFRGKTLRHERMVLLGRNSSEISRVGNFLLDRNAFDTEEQQSERARGMVEGRYVTLVNTPHLFNTQLSVEDLSLRAKESMHLCAPGPHAVLLVLQPDECTQKNWDQKKTALSLFSDTALKDNTVLIIQTRGPGTDPLKENQHLKEIVKQCGGRYYLYHNGSARSDLFKVIEKMKRTLRCSVHGEHHEREGRRKHSANIPKGMTGGPIRLTPSTATETTTLSERLNLVLCGTDGAVKSSISDLILGQREPSPGSSSVCVRREGAVCGRLVTLVEMPALYNTQLSEEEVMQESLRCVSLCDPGVHAFLLVVPEGRLTDEDKGELEKVQRIFGSRFSDHAVVLITRHTLSRAESVSTVIEHFGNRHLVFTNSSQVPELIKQVEELLTENGCSQYTTETYLSAQIQIQLEYQREVAGLKRKMSELRINLPKTLRVLLLGKTGAGKSATGNTIFGQEDVFKEDISGESVTTVCQKETTEINDREVTVIDTPGLFDTPSSNVSSRDEIIKSISMAAPGPHAFLLVVPIVRFKQDGSETLKMIQNVFGDDSIRYTMVLFTRGDDLRKKSIEQFIENSEQSTKNLIRTCGNRYHVFNNRNHEDRDQVTALLEKIDSMVAGNGGSCYTNEAFQQMEKQMQGNQEKEEEEEEDEEMQSMRKNIEKQREQQLLWYQGHMLKRTLQQEHDEALREGGSSPEGTGKFSEV